MSARAPIQVGMCVFLRDGMGGRVWGAGRDGGGKDAGVGGGWEGREEARTQTEDYKDSRPHFSQSRGYLATGAITTASEDKDMYVCVPSESSRRAIASDP